MIKQTKTKHDTLDQTVTEFSTYLIGLCMSCVPFRTTGLNCVVGHLSLAQNPSFSALDFANDRRPKANDH
jgi:hypothetical protein